jgi:hypothetical protein
MTATGSMGLRNDMMTDTEREGLLDHAITTTTTTTSPRTTTAISNDRAGPADGTAFHVTGRRGMTALPSVPGDLHSHLTTGPTTARHVSGNSQQVTRNEVTKQDCQRLPESLSSKDKYAEKDKEREGSKNSKNRGHSVDFLRRSFSSTMPFMRSKRGSKAPKSPVDGEGGIINASQDMEVGADRHGPGPFNGVGAERQKQGQMQIQQQDLRQRPRQKDKRTNSSADRLSCFFSPDMTVDNAEDSGEDSDDTITYDITKAPSKSKPKSTTSNNRERRDVVDFEGDSMTPVTTRTHDIHNTLVATNKIDDFGRQDKVTPAAPAPAAPAPAPVAAPAPAQSMSTPTPTPKFTSRSKAALLRTALFGLPPTNPDPNPNPNPNKTSQSHTSPRPSSFSYPCADSFFTQNRHPNPHPHAPRDLRLPESDLSTKMHSAKRLAKLAKAKKCEKLMEEVGRLTEEVRRLNAENRILRDHVFDTYSASGGHHVGSGESRVERDVGGGFDGSGADDSGIRDDLGEGRVISEGNDRSRVGIGAGAGTNATMVDRNANRRAKVFSNNSAEILNGPCIQDRNDRGRNRESRYLEDINVFVTKDTHSSNGTGVEGHGAGNDNGDEEAAFSLISPRHSRHVLSNEHAEVVHGKGKDIENSTEKGKGKMRGARESWPTDRTNSGSRPASASASASASAFTATLTNAVADHDDSDLYRQQSSANDESKSRATAAN